MDENKTYRIADAAGVAIHMAVVRDSTDGRVKKPAAAGAGKFVGLTQEAQDTQYGPVPVKCGGLSFATMYGSGSYGDALDIADTTGRLRSCQTALEDTAEAGGAYLTHVVAFAEQTWTQTGDVILVRIQPFTKLTPVS